MFINYLLTFKVNCKGHEVMECIVAEVYILEDLWILMAGFKVAQLFGS